jgi:hypothetical protein
VAVQKRTRLTVDISPELRHRIKIAAAERDVSVRDYVVQSIERTLDGGIDTERAGGNYLTPELVEQLRKTRGAIMRGRTFTVDSVDLINQGREIRSRELDRNGSD